MRGLPVPEIVLPSQFLGERPSPSRVSGEHRLALAILVDAIQIYRMEGSGGRNLQLRREVEAWFNSDDRSWCFAFERICEALGLDPHCIRRGVCAPRERLLLRGGPPPRDAGRADSGAWPRHPRMQLSRRPP